MGVAWTNKRVNAELFVFSIYISNIVPDTYILNLVI